MMRDQDDESVVMRDQDENIEVERMIMKREAGEQEGDCVRAVKKRRG